MTNSNFIGCSTGKSGSDERFLVITAVKPNGDNRWVAEGNYGANKENLGRKTFDLSLENGEMVITFMAGMDPARLVRKGDNTVEGMLETAFVRSGDAVRLAHRPFRLKKS